jgi:Flp pilus assembly protein TadD
MRSFFFSKVYPSLPIFKFLIIVMACGLCACSESVRKVSYINDDYSGTLTSQAPDDKLTPLQSKSPQELVTAGFIYLSNNNLKIAELHFFTAISKKPDSVEGYLGLGQVEMHKANYPLALANFTKAAEFKPDSVPALIGQAQALRFQGKLNSAIKKINEAMMYAPDDIYVLRELAMIYDLMGKESLSEPLYHEIVEKAPDQASSHNNLGLNYMVRKEYSKAILSFLQALDLDRNNQRIKNNLASAYLLNGDERNAIQIFEKTVGEAAAYNNIGYLYMTQGDFDKAEQALNKALQLNPRFYVRAQENLDKLQQLRRTNTNSEK